MDNKVSSLSNTKVNSSSFSFLFSFAAVWFGTHVGGGFASGSQTMNFFIKYGWYAVFTPAISILIIGLVYREQLIIANHYRVFDYNSMSHKLYAPYDKIMSPIYELCNIMTGLLAISASVAGASALVTELFGLPYFISVIVLGVGILMLALYGSGLIRKISTLLTIIIVVSFVVICTKGISMQSVQLSTIVAEKQSTTGFGPALWQAIIYAGYQCFAFMGVLSSADGLKTKSNTSKAMAIGFVLNTVMILLTSILMVAWLPQLGNETLPILAITKHMGGGVLMWLYSAGLFAAFLSTAVSATFGTTTRFSKFREKTSKTGIFANEQTFKILVGTLVIGISMLVSSLGLTKIVAIGYGYSGLIGVFLVIVPTLTYGHYLNKKFEKENPDFEERVLQMD